MPSAVLTPRPTLLAAATVALLLATPAVAASRPHHRPTTIRFVAPHAGQQLARLDPAHCRIAVHAAAGVRSIALRLDGRRLKRTRRDHCVPAKPSAAAAMTSPGRHRLTALVVDRRGRRARTAVVFRIRTTRGSVATRTARPDGAKPNTQPAAPTAPASSSTPQTASGWSADFSTGDFAQWSWWGQGQSDIWGHIAVVTPAAAGVPAPPTGAANVAQMTVTAADAAAGRINAKLYKDFSRPDGAGGKRPPADVSGTYSQWYYLPPDFSVTHGDWVNIFQFKEQYGSGESDPLWWVQLGDAGWAESYGGATWLDSRPARASAPVAFLTYWNNHFERQMVFAPLPLGRWFQITASVHQGDRIDFAIDGKPFDTARASEYPVSPFHADSLGWTFGTGDYATSPDTTLYLSTAAYAPA